MTLMPKEGAYEGSQVLDQHSLWLGLEQENNRSSSLLLLWVELWRPGPKSGSQRVGPTVVYPSQSQTMRSTAWPSPLQAERARKNGRRDLWAGKSGLNSSCLQAGAPSDPKDNSVTAGSLFLSHPGECWRMPPVDTSTLLIGTLSGLLC